MRESDQPEVGVLFHRLGPYHLPRLEAANRRLRLLAVELAADTADYAWDRVQEPAGLRRVTVFPEGDGRQAPTAELVRRLGAVLDQHRPQAVAIPGWSDKAALIALRWSVDRGVPVIMMSDSTVWDDRRTRFKEWVKSELVRRCAAGLVAGAPQADYLTSLGLPRDRIFTGYDVVDNTHFAAGAAAARNRRSEVRSQYGLPENYWLACARFVEKKNLPGLIRAYARYRKLIHGTASRGSGAVAPWDLVVLGDGPLKPELCHLIAALGLQNFVHLPGFRQYGDLPAYYGLANAFVHASTTEQWGLVVNEALAAGLPVLVSRRCGCASDLVRERVNGFAFDPSDTEQLANLMSSMTAMPPSQRTRMGAAGAELIAEWGPDRFAQGLVQAVQSSRRSKPESASVLQRLVLRLLLLR